MPDRTPDEILSQLAEQAELLKAILTYGPRDADSSDLQVSALKYRLGLLAELDETRKPMRKAWEKIDELMRYSRPISLSDIGLNPHPPDESTSGKTRPTEG